MMPITNRMAVLDGRGSLSLSVQRRLLGVPRERRYYEPQPESQLNLYFMQLIGVHHQTHPNRGPRVCSPGLA
jgi:hypothetical protein